MTTIKNLSEFKKAIKVGVMLHCFNHPSNKDMGIRPVSIVQSNSFALATKKIETSGPDRGIEKTINSWCKFEKSGNYLFDGSNTVKIFWGEGEKRELCLTYTFID